MEENTLTSIVISSYNYWRFLWEAIDSALGRVGFGYSSYPFYEPSFS